MALMIKCEKHNIGYISADLYPAWWTMHNVPGCPLCRLEWIEEYEYEWNFPVPYDLMRAAALRTVDKAHRFNNPGG